MGKTGPNVEVMNQAQKIDDAMEIAILVVLILRTVCLGLEPDDACSDMQTPS